MIMHEGKGKPCKHLMGDEPGKYSCAVHNEPWYNQTPCFAYNQVERTHKSVCRMGEYVMSRKFLS